MNILITGGAGYIGSHVAKQLLQNTKYNIIILDNLSTGNLNTINTLKSIREFDFIQLDLKEFDKVEEIFLNKNIEVVIHFAAFSQVGESINNPMKYYMNNTVNTANLVKFASKYNVLKFIFSSTAAVYGEPKFDSTIDMSIDENFDTIPINPYGMSKLMSETIIKDEGKVNPNFKYIIFRYFNVAGADINYNNNELIPKIGECHNPETHLIPLVIKAALNKRDSITIFGDDYDTEDGTCIRDYIHVDDLAMAHIQAIGYLNVNESDIFNCGYGKGYSVREIINTVKEVSSKEFKVLDGDRRIGDPSVLVANNNKIIFNMNWKPKYNNLNLICKSAYIWEQQL